MRLRVHLSNRRVFLLGISQRLYVPKLQRCLLKSVNLPVRYSIAGSHTFDISSRRLLGMGSCLCPDVSKVLHFNETILRVHRRNSGVTWKCIGYGAKYGAQTHQSGTRNPE
jgi:hypothetical protein